MRLLVTGVCALAGLALAPLLNMVILVVPERRRPWPPAPPCPSCGFGAPSWLLVRGRCRRCHGRLPVRRLVVELGAAGLLGAAGAHLSQSWALPAFCVFFASLLTITAIDLDHFIIPNRVIYPTLALTIPLLVLAAGIGDDWQRARTAAFGGVASFLVLFVVHTISPRGMGFGDVRLSGLIGMMLGWLGLGYAALGLFAAFALASVVGLALLATRIRGRKDAVPFGPFMAAGAVIAVLWGRPLLDAYLHTRG